MVAHGSLGKEGPLESGDRRKKRYSRLDIEHWNENRQDAYRADPEHQCFLNNLNDELTDLEASLTAESLDPQRAVVFIVGVIRSGSSFLYQVIAGSDEFAYISNFSARFWLAPHTGCLLERILGIRKALYKPNFKSEFGKIPGLQAPHEFQFFWDQWFAQGQPTQALSESELAQIDVPSLQQAIAGIEAVWQKPVLLKSLFWFAYQIGFLANAFPRSLFVHIHRDPFFVAQSIAVSRKRVQGDLDAWWGPRPPEYAELCKKDWPDQIMGQVLYTGQQIHESTEALPESRTLSISYDDLCRNPDGCLQRLQAKLAGLDEAVDIARLEIPPFEPSRKQQLPDQEYDLLRNAYEKWFKGPLVEPKA
jgi:sulfotransferase family protein